MNKRRKYNKVVIITEGWTAVRPFNPLNLGCNRYQIKAGML